MRTEQPLDNLGFKVFDRRREEVEPLLLQALRERRPIEIGLYYHDPATHDLCNALLPGSGCQLNTHFDHRRLNLFALRDSDLLSALRRQIEISMHWGAGYGINHLSAFTLSPRPEYQAALEARLLESLHQLERLCREYRFAIHIENTYHDIDLYRRLFAAIGRAGFEHLHFCFDFGHAKVWSTRPLRAWLDFLGELEGDGRRLHFHLHTNRGLSDEHLSFLEAEWLDLCGMDDYTAPWNCFEAVSALDTRFPQARKVMEIQPGEARENLQLVIEEIARIRRRDALISA